MKTTENGSFRYQVAKPGLGLYLGMGFAAAAGLALGLGGKVVWQRLAVSQGINLNPTAGGVSVVDPAKQAGPNPAEKQLVAEAFTDAFGPPAGLPSGLAQLATDLPDESNSEKVVSQVRFAEAGPKAAQVSDLSMGFLQPGNPSAEHMTLLGVGTTSGAGLQGSIQLEAPRVGNYQGSVRQDGLRAVAGSIHMPAQIRPIHIRTIGPDGLERVGVDFERIELDFQGAAGQPVVQGGFILPSGQTAVVFGDGRQSGGGAGGMAKVGPSAVQLDNGKAGNDTGTLGAEEHQPLVGSFTTRFEDGYMKLPEELAGWVIAGKIYIAPGPEGGLRMAGLEDLERMFFEENESIRDGVTGGEAMSAIRKMARRFYGLMTQCTVEEDEEGNLWIPLGEAVARQASLGGEVVIVGMRSHAEIWSKSAWESEISGQKQNHEIREPKPKPLELPKVENR